MAPTTFRRAAATVLSLLSAAAYFGMPTARGQASYCASARQRENERRAAVDEALTQITQVNTEDLRQRRAACGSDKHCLDQVAEYYETRHRGLLKLRAAEEASHDRAMVDIERYCVPYSLPQKTACDRARATEAHDYANNMALLRKKEISDRQENENDRIDCGIRSLPCQREVEQKQQQRLARQERETRAEDQRHHRALLNIDSQCSTPSTASRGRANDPEPTREPPDLVSTASAESREEAAFVSAERKARVDTESTRHVEFEKSLGWLKEQVARLQDSGLSVGAVIRANTGPAVMRSLQRLLDLEQRRYDAAIRELTGR